VATEALFWVPINSYVPRGLRALYLPFMLKMKSSMQNYAVKAVSKFCSD
jgi:hypothetical protein